LIVAGVPQTGIAMPGEFGPATPAPYRSAESFGAGLGAELEQAGGALHQDQVRAIRIEKSRQQESDNAAAGLAAAQLSVDLTEDAAKAREDAPLDGSGHVAMVTQAADNRINQFLSGIGDERVRQRWSVQAAEMRARLVGDEDGWARGRRIEAVGTNVREAGRLWDNQLQTNPDPHALEDALKAVDTTLEGFDLPADVKDKLGREEKASRAYNYGHGLNEKDPAAGLAAAQSGIFDQWITPEQKKALVNEAQTNVRIADADARRVQAQAVAEVRQAVTEFKQRVDRGELPSDEETGKLVGRAQALGLADVVDDIGYSTGKLKYSRITDKWTSTEWEHNVNSLAAKVGSGKATAEEQQELKILQELRPAKEARFRADPDGFAAAGGMPPPQVDLAHPDAGSIHARKSWARAFAPTAGLIEPPYLSKDQLQVYRDRANQGPVGQLEVATELKQTWGDAAPSIVRQIGGEAKADMTIMLGLNPRMAQVYQRGVEALSKKAVKFNDDAARQAFAPYMQAVPADLRPALFDAARNIAAGWMSEQGKAEPTADFADVVAKAVHRAGGMLGSWGEGSATGGFANWNGHYAWLPQDMTRRDFQGRISRALPADWSKAAVDAGGSPSSSAPYHLGPDGKRVAYKPDELARFGKGTLQTVAPGIYRLVDPAGGTVVDQDGRPWQFDVRRLPLSHVGSRAR
jgi:hypothetical protein